MASVQQPTTRNIRSSTDEPRTGKEKLEELKAKLFPPETKLQRVARALEALQQAKRVSTLDVATLRYLAQHTDLEGE